MFQLLSEANNGVIDLKPGMVLSLPDFNKNPVVTQDWMDKAQQVTNQYQTSLQPITQGNIPPITTKLIEDNPGVNNFVVGGSYYIDKNRDRQKANASFGSLGGAMGSNVPKVTNSFVNATPGGIDKNKDRQNAIYGTNKPITYKDYSSLVGGNVDYTEYLASRTPTPGPQVNPRAQERVAISTTGGIDKNKDRQNAQYSSTIRPTAGQPTQFGLVENSASDRGRPTAQQMYEETLKAMTPSMFNTFDDTTGKEYFMQANKDGTYSEMKRDVGRSGDTSLQWIPTGETYIDGETADGEPTYLSKTMLDTWKAWDSFGQVPQTFEADWAITLGLNATFMKKWKFTLDPNTMTWYQPGQNPSLGQTSYGEGMSSGTPISIPEFLISPDDWAQGYRPNKVGLSQAAKLGISDAMMRENGYTYTTSGWVKGGSGGGGSSYSPQPTGGYTGYPQTQSKNWRTATG